MTDHASPASADAENSLIAERREKLAALRAAGVPAFPNDFKPGHHAADLQTHHGAKSTELLEDQAIQASVANGS